MVLLHRAVAMLLLQPRMPWPRSAGVRVAVQTSVWACAGAARASSAAAASRARQARAPRTRVAAFSRGRSRRHREARRGPLALSRDMTHPVGSRLSAVGSRLWVSSAQSLLPRCPSALHCFIVISSVVVCSPLRPCSGSCGVFPLLPLRGSVRASTSARSPVWLGVRHHPGPDACFRGRPGGTMWVVVVGLPVSRR